MIEETKKRTIVKSISWRILATLNSYLTLVSILNKSKLLLAISMNISGFIIFYLFERAWNKIQWGRHRLEKTDKQK